jgi:hypothetical protein
LPFRIAAAARRSSIRPLVQEPMKTVSISISVQRRARRQPHVVERALRGVDLAALEILGAGTTPVIGSTSSGEVPQVTTGAISSPLMVTTLSQWASSSE